MLLELIVLSIIVLFIFSAKVIYSTKNLPKDYKERVFNKFLVEDFNPLTSLISSSYINEIENNHNNSGAILIKNGSFALYHRVALARMAQYSIELQTYIYENDFVSQILMYELKLAADRGVKVRIIVDDNGLSKDSDHILNLNYHPNIQVKVFNPFRYRNKLLKYPQFLLNINRLNYRMHNKLFIVDSSAVIAGGRNIASNYFDNNDSFNFSDTDVLFIGKAARDAVESFNKYWVYHKSIPVDVFYHKNNARELTDFSRSMEEYGKIYHQKKDKFNHIINSFINAYKNKEFSIYWGYANLIYDNPEKTDAQGEISPIIKALKDLWKDTRKSLYIVSAYFVPGKNGTDNLSAVSKSGVSINILTNSLSSTDALVVYAAWSRYRRRLLKNNISIYEFKNNGYKVKNKVKSGASLHSKTMVIDEHISWIGSFNLDGRSALYNTEVIVSFDNKDFAKELLKSMKHDMSMYKSWHLHLKKGITYWQSNIDNVKRVTTVSPDTNIFIRIFSLLLRIIPEKLV